MRFLAKTPSAKHINFISRRRLAHWSAATHSLVTRTRRLRRVRVRRRRSPSAVSIGEQMVWLDFDKWFDHLCDIENLCLETVDTSWLGVAFEALLFVYSFCALAEVADVYLAPALECLCFRWNVPEDAAGASFLALGGAAPEIIISMISTLKGNLQHAKSTRASHALEASATLSRTSAHSSRLAL